MTVIKTVRKGWTEQYGLMVYELVASVDGTEFRAVRTVSMQTWENDLLSGDIEYSAREQITKEASEYAARQAVS